jgi:hypothetical protein
MRSGNRGPVPGALGEGRGCRADPQRHNGPWYRHTITCADSADPDDHPASVAEAFDVGYAYVYELRPE